MTSPVCRVQAFLAAGHVCTVMGTCGVPGARRAVRGADRGHRLRAARHPRGHPAHRAPARGGPARGRERLPACRRRTTGNPIAIEMLEDVFEVVDRSWRGIGMIPQSGWRLSERYRAYDAEHRFEVGDIHTQESSICRSGEVLQGLIKPHECAAFGTRVHAAQPARRHHGLAARAPARRTTSTGGCRCRRRPSGCPWVPEPRTRPADGHRVDLHRAADAASRAGPVRCRCATARTS